MAKTTTTTKKCSKCGTTKPADQFPNTTIPTCKACASKKKKKRGGK